MAQSPTVTQDLDLAALASRFGSEDKCRAYLEQLRWPDGVRCPRCDARRGISRLAKRGQFDCAACGYQFSVRVGTVLHDSHLPLWKWCLAVYLMVESESGVSANQLKRTLGVSYKTAWYLCHRIRSVMGDTAAEPRRRAAPAAGGRDPHARLQVGEPYQQLSAKHLRAYLDEMAFRRDNQGNPYRFRDTLLRLIQGPSMPYTDLTASA